MSASCIQVSPSFLDGASSLSKETKSKLLKCLSLLCNNYRHPSLQTKKIKGNSDNVYECRVDSNIRLIYDIQGLCIRCWHVGPHDHAIRQGENISPPGFIYEEISFIRPPSSASHLGSDELLEMNHLEFVEISLEDLTRRFDEGTE